jgi:hypothetical protein
MVGLLRLAEADTAGFAVGKWLANTGDYRLVVDGYGEFRHDDLNQALGWRDAARRFGFEVEVYTT